MHLIEPFRRLAKGGGGGGGARCFLFLLVAVLFLNKCFQASKYLISECLLVPSSLSDCGICSPLILLYELLLSKFILPQN